MSPYDGGDIEVPGFKARKVPYVAMLIFGCVLSFGVATMFYQREIGRPGEQILTLKAAQATMQTEMLEYGRHLGEPPVTQVNVREGVKVGVFEDLCLLITTQTDAGPRSKLIMDLSKDHDRQHSRATLPTFVQPVEASSQRQPQCLNPHPNQFRTWNGRFSGGQCGWLEVWRQWPDGCTHYQLFDTCHGVWDPAIHWTACVH